MIMIWNQREVFVGDSMQNFNDLRDILDANKIQYKHKIVDPKSAYLFDSRKWIAGLFGKNKDHIKIYCIFVHKRDYDNACGMMEETRKEINGIE